MNTVFPVQTIPESETIFSFMRKNTNYGRACGAVRMRLRDISKIELELVDVDLEKLKQSVSILSPHTAFRDGAIRAARAKPMAASR